MARCGKGTGTQTDGQAIRIYNKCEGGIENRQTVNHSLLNNSRNLFRF